MEYYGEKRAILYLVLITAISFLVFMLAGENFTRAVLDVTTTMFE